MNSPINIECQRYGCMKNLLACYANCRFNLRCDDLREVLVGQQEQAEQLLNDYRLTRDQPPVRIQFLARSLKFVAQEKAPLRTRKPQPKKTKRAKKRK